LHVVLDLPAFGRFVNALKIFAYRILSIVLSCNRRTK